MFDTLLQLPLFQGLAQEDFTNILGKVKLHFVRHKAGVCIIKAGEVCNRLVFVLKGEVEAFTTKADIPYGVTEFFQAPYLLEPQSMFGMNTSFVTNYTASAETDTVSISKSFVLNELFKYEIFRLNYMNIISNRAQSLKARLWMPVPDDTEGRIVHFICQRCEQSNGKKALKIKMEELARKCGTKVFLIDNLMMVDLECSEEGRNQAEKSFVQDLLMFAKKYNTLKIFFLPPGNIFFYSC